jgi:hypothetical protein
MVLRKMRHPRRYEVGDDGSEIPQESKDTGMVTRRRESQGKTNVKSNPIAQTNAEERRRDENTRQRLHRSRRRESARDTSDIAKVEVASGVRAILETRGRTDTPANRKSSADQTPLRSTNGSETSATQTRHTINTRSKGRSLKSLNSNPLSDQADDVRVSTYFILFRLFLRSRRNVT